MGKRNNEEETVELDEMKDLASSTISLSKSTVGAKDRFILICTSPEMGRVVLYLNDRKVSRFRSLLKKCK